MCCVQYTRFVSEMQKVQKVSAAGNAGGSAGPGRERESGEQYLPERSRASGPPLEMSTDDDGRLCCNSRQNGIVQPLLTGTCAWEERSEGGRGAQRRSARQANLNPVVLLSG